MIVFFQSENHIRGVWWDGSNSHRRRHVSREVICMKNRDGSISKWLKISIMCLFAEMAHFLSHLDFSRPQKVSHLSKKTRDRDFEPFWNWAISISHAYDFTWDMSPSMTFWAISPYPPYTYFIPKKALLLRFFAAYLHWTDWNFASFAYCNAKCSATVKTLHPSR